MMIEDIIRTTLLYRWLWMSEKEIRLTADLVRLRKDKKSKIDFLVGAMERAPRRYVNRSSMGDG